MAAEIKQGLKSTVKTGGGSIAYWVRNTLDYAEARDLFLATRPDTFNGAPFTTYQGDEGNEWKIWEFVAQYQSSNTPTPDSEKSGNIYINHETSGGTVHVSHSLATVESHCLPCMKSRPSLWKYGLITPNSWSILNAGVIEPGCTETAPTITDPKPVNGVTTAYGIVRPIPGDPAYVEPKAPWTGGAINITKDGIQGVDIPNAETKFTITLYLATLTKLQIKALDDIKQHVNAVPILAWPCPDYAIGEVRFESWSKNDQGRENIEVRLNFIREQNLTNITVGGITGINKRGHEYLWFECREFEDPISHTISKQPIYARVEQLFFWSDFQIIFQLIQQSNQQASL